MGIQFEALLCGGGSWAFVAFNSKPSFMVAVLGHLWAYNSKPSPMVVVLGHLWALVALL